MAEKPQHLVLDTVDDRREIVRLLSRLRPADRVAWLRRQCRRSVLECSAVRPQVSAATLELADLARWDSSAAERLTVECYMDVFSLSVQYGLDLDLALSDLVQAVRRSGSSPAVPGPHPGGSSGTSGPFR